MVVKVVISAPYEPGTEEYANFMDNIGKFVATSNEPEMKLHVCETCESCGAVNDTVISIQKGKRMVKLCDLCADA
jgi:RNase P subunit RPR2